MGKAFVGCLTAVLVLALWAAFSSFIGWVAAWVLLQFGVHVSWLVCAIAIWLITVIGRGIFGSGK